MEIGFVDQVEPFQIAGAQQCFGECCYALECDHHFGLGHFLF